MRLKQIAEKKWVYTLYQSDDGYILSVLCGSSAMYQLNIPLSKNESDKAIGDADYLNELVKDIQQHPKKYASRSIKI